MKSYTLPELRTFVREQAAGLLDAQLQEVLVNDRGLALGFWKQGRTLWLLIDLAPNTPLAFIFEKSAPFVKAKPKPLSLFLNSHGRDKVVREVFLREEFGRVLSLLLSNREGECEIEIQLIPKQANIIVRADGKQVAWDRPKVLTPAPAAGELPAERDLQALREEWSAAQAAAGPRTARDPQEQWRRKRDRDLEKKRKALAEIERQMDSDEAASWYALGDRLKAGEGTPIDAGKPLSWNIEQAYAKAKQSAGKRKGSEERRVILRQEIAALEQAVFSPKEVSERPKADLLKKSAARGRTLPLSDGLVAFLGKSAADNLAMLRKARAWDHWLHLRDYPGAHVIIQRNRDQIVSDADLRKTAQWLAKEALGSKVVAGARLEVVLAECRFVRPIKGDRIGRVTYHGERHFFVDVG